MDTPSVTDAPRRLFRRVLKVLLGLLFVVSAVLKIVDMDPFEIYVYSYGFFSLNVSLVVARLAIVLELVLGIALILNWFHKLIWWGSLLMLLGYTGLMVYALLQGRTDHCHCFGDILRFDPLQSLIKNLVLLLWLALLYPLKGRGFRGQWLALLGLSLACVCAVFVVSPPDFLLHSESEGRQVDPERLETMLRQPPLAAQRLDEGKKVVGVFSAGCALCRMTARKLSLMQAFHGFPEQDVCFVFMGKEADVEAFYEAAESAKFHFVVMDNPLPLLKLVDGKFPTVLLLEEGRVVQLFGFRDLDETAIKKFFAE